MEERHPDTCAVIIDQANRRIIEIRKSMLVNQITRDADRIAKSFDALHAGDLERVSSQFAHCFGVLTSGMLKATEEGDDLRIACGELLSNSLNSIAAAAYMLRGGFVLQPGPVIRSAIESMAVARLHQWTGANRKVCGNKCRSLMAEICNKYNMIRFLENC